MEAERPYWELTFPSGTKEKKPLEHMVRSDTGEERGQTKKEDQRRAGVSLKGHVKGKSKKLVKRGGGQKKEDNALSLKRGTFQGAT